MSAQGRSTTDASAFVLDGAAIAEGVLAKVAEEARALSAHGVTPGLAVVLVGDNPASQTYIAGKGRAAKACGFHSIQHTLPAETSEAELLTLVEALNADPAVHGVLVQLPLPEHIDLSRVLEAIAPAKDVDGFHPINVGLLSIGDTSRALIPCTPAGAMILIDRACERLGWTLPGMEAVIIGRSNIVGKPMAQLLLARHCTVTVAHSRTLDLPFGRPPRRHPRRRRRPAGDGARRLGQARRDRDRRRHQPRASPWPRRFRLTPRRASSATSPMPRPPRSRARSPPCPAASAA